MEKLRPFWERQENYASLYQTGKVKLPLFTKTGEQKLNYELDVNIAVLDKLLQKRIELGIANFFECLKATFKDKLGREIHKVHIFLAGNGSRSELLTELFETYMISYATDLRTHENTNIDNGFFELHPALGMSDIPFENPVTARNLRGIDRAASPSNSNIEDLVQENSDIGGLARQSLLQGFSAQNDLNSITRPNGKTGVAFGLLEGRPGGRIKIIMPQARDAGKKISDVRFRFYIGYKKKNCFQMISDPTLPYHQWTYLCDASTEDFAIYYTPRSEATSGKMNIFDVYKKNCRISKAHDNAAIYYRAIAHDAIEYTVFTGEKFDSKSMLEEIVRVDLEY